MLPNMDIVKMLSELREEQRTIEEAIATLERLASGHGKRRGRPPAWISAVKENRSKRRGRPPGSRNKANSANDPINSAIDPIRNNFLSPFPASDSNFFHVARHSPSLGLGTR